MYSNSKKWIAPNVRQRQRHDKLNQARAKLCKKSPFWTINFDLDTHKREFAALQQARLDSLEASNPSSSSASSAIGSPQLCLAQIDLPSTPTNASSLPDTPLTSPPASCPSPFAGRMASGIMYDGTPSTLATNFSAVLSMRTVFSPGFRNGKDVFAPWPSRSEMKYEGDDRIATDPLHRRFLGVPRVEGNETVNWQHRNVIEQYPLEDWYIIPTESEADWKAHHVPEMEADNESVEEAWQLISRELYEMLDPVDRL